MPAVRSSCQSLPALNLPQIYLRRSGPGATVCSLPGPARLSAHHVYPSARRRARESQGSDLKIRKGKKISLYLARPQTFYWGVSRKWFKSDLWNDALCVGNCNPVARQLGSMYVAPVTLSVRRVESGSFTWTIMKAKGRNISLRFVAQLLWKGPEVTL